MTTTRSLSIEMVADIFMHIGVNRVILKKEKKNYDDEIKSN